MRKPGFRLIPSCVTLGVAGLAAWSVATAAALADQPEAARKSIVQTAAGNDAFETLVAAVKSADLAGTLDGGEFTVFAPTDDAFAKIAGSDLKRLLQPENKSKLQEILKYHVVPGRVLAGEVVRRTSLTTIGGQRIDVALDGGAVRVDESTVAKTDILCTNGVIHVIDTVLMPNQKDIVDTAAETGKFKTLLAAAKAAGLVDALKADGPLTVLAPSDKAFEKLGHDAIDQLLKPESKQRLAEILTYHVISGRVFADEALRAVTAETLANQPVRFRLADGRLKVNDATIVRTDIDARNGVIHVIDTVLIPQAAAPSQAMMTLGDVTPAKLIELAIERGVPQFNGGNASACAAIYEVTALSLLAMPATAVGAGVRNELGAAINEAGSKHDESERAWVLRRALDSAYRQLSSNMTPSR